MSKMISDRMLKEKIKRIGIVERAILDVKKLASKLNQFNIWGDSVLNDVAKELEMSIVKERGLITDWKLYNDSQKRRRRK